MPSLEGVWEIFLLHTVFLAEYAKIALFTTTGYIVAEDVKNRVEVHSHWFGTSWITIQQIVVLMPSFTLHDPRWVRNVGRRYTVELLPLTSAANRFSQI